MTELPPPLVPAAGPPAGPWHIEVLAGLRGRLRRWPAVFPRAAGEPVLALAASVETRLVAGLIAPDVDGLMLIKETLRRYCQSNQYLAALARDGAMLHDADGRPVAPVAAWQRAAALKALETSRRLAVRHAPPQTTEEIMVTVKALKVTAVLPAEQLTASDAATVVLQLATPDGAKASARITGKAYRRALSQIAALGADQAVVVVQGSIKRPGQLEGAGLSVQPRKAPEPPAPSDAPQAAQG